MRVLIHADKGEKKAAALEKMIQVQLPEILLHRSRDMSEFAGVLGQPLNNISVIIIFIPIPETLNTLFSLKSFFDNKKLILVPAVWDNRTFIRGLQLNPSFISTADTDMEDVFMVLKRISQRRCTMTKISMQMNNGIYK